MCEYQNWSLDSFGFPLGPAHVRFLGSKLEAQVKLENRPLNQRKTNLKKIPRWLVEPPCSIVLCENRAPQSHNRKKQKNGNKQKTARQIRRPERGARIHGAAGGASTHLGARLFTTLGCGLAGKKTKTFGCRSKIG